MDKVIIVFVILACSVASYFFGVQQGQTSVKQLEVQQTAMRQSETITSFAQYLAMLNLGKTDELSLLIKSRILAEKTQLQAKMASEELSNKKILQATIETAEEVLKSE
ncbi:MAG: hypothetical protein V2I33_00510 [Kangiellaceae bacterium]|jgi:hypothetical protein|nr:hypothetical protein [Kangiellaceae bacterium]